MAKQKDNKQQEKKVEFVNTTPVGEKKNTNEAMIAAYHPAAVEAAWYDWWEKCGYLQANNSEDDTREKFVICIPPPNVTGALHLGHALTVSIQDCLCRWHRMNGKNVLYLPGVDHAGIATQVVVEKTLAKEQEGFSRHDLGRDAFIDKVWEWKDKYGKRIVSQLKRIGASLDWSRERFTMDPQLSKAVTEAFVRLSEKGLIYRDTKLVNWCCKLRTAISNIEVEHEEFDKPERLMVPGHDEKRKYDFGYIWSFAYKVEDSDREVVVSTTRPETMLGDTAVAVHPDDDRYKDLHGKFLIHPFNNRRIPIITDAKLVDPKFGTGAVKITPAHDPNDYECGKRHKLEFINVLTDEGKLNENGAPFTGMMRYDARNAVIKGLEEKGLYRDKQPHKLAIGKCSRSGDIIEPMLKPQWYVDFREVAALSVQKVKNEELKIFPERERETWYRWLENLQDWCISRQLWWGHRIPAYFATVKGREAEFDKANTSDWFVARSREEALQAAVQKLGVDASEITLEQDEDVLDTWFSSGLFPFSTMGWPDNTPDMKAFYPNQMLETGLDILFFWVARMVMMGLSLTDTLPFDTVFLHAMVRDKTGKKMSKSLGNVIDPIDVIEGITLEDLNKQLYLGNLSKHAIEKAIKLQAFQFPQGIPECGTDALRFTLLNFSTPQGRDINLDVYRVNGYRMFCNKLWNATKFALQNLTGFEWTNDELPNIDDLGFTDKWILSRLNHMIKESNEAIAIYDFQRYTTAAYEFFLKELCDVYLEMIKPVMNLDASSEENAKRKRASQLVLFTCLEQGFRILHPAMPFLTEELWQRLPGVNKLPKSRESIMVNTYPKPVDAWANAQIETEMEYVNEIIHHIRSAKAAYQLTFKQKPDVYVKSTSQSHADLIIRQSAEIEGLACSGKLILAGSEPIPQGCAVEIVDKATELHIVLKGMIDFNVEIEKQKKNMTKLQQAYDNLIKKMNLPSYKEKVPERVQIDDLAKAESYKLELEKFVVAIESLQKLL